jgi:hypothetical protein
MTIKPVSIGLERRRRQSNAGLFTTVETTDPASCHPHVAFGAFNDDAGGAHLTIGSCLSTEGNTYRPVFELDMAGVVKILGQTLIVP